MKYWVIVLYKLFFEGSSFFAIILAFIFFLQVEKQSKNLKRFCFSFAFLSVEITICANQISVKNVFMVIMTSNYNFPIVMKCNLKCHYYGIMKILIVKKYKDILEVLHWKDTVTVSCCFPSNNPLMW